MFGLGFDKTEKTIERLRSHFATPGRELRCLSYSVVSEVLEFPFRVPFEVIVGRLQSFESELALFQQTVHRVLQHSLAVGAHKPQVVTRSRGHLTTLEDDLVVSELSRSFHDVSVLRTTHPLQRLQALGALGGQKRADLIERLMSLFC